MACRRGCQGSSGEGDEESRGLGHAAEAGPAGVKAEVSQLPRNQQAEPLGEGGDGEARGAGTGGGRRSGATP